MSLDLILMGPPGAGKGTQAARIASDRGLAHIATGDMLRAAVRDGTPLGLEAKAIMARGDLVSDDLIIAMFRERLGAPDTEPGVLLDGFPRTSAQAEALDGMLDGLGRKIASVVVLEVGLDELIRRLSGPPRVPRRRPRLPRRVPPAGRRGGLRHRRLGALPARRRS